MLCKRRETAGAFIEEQSKASARPYTMLSASGLSSFSGQHCIEFTMYAAFRLLLPSETYTDAAALEVVEVRTQSA